MQKVGQTVKELQQSLIDLPTPQESSGELQAYISEETNIILTVSSCSDDFHHQEIRRMWNDALPC